MLSPQNYGKIFRRLRHVPILCCTYIFCQKEVTRKRLTSYSPPRREGKKANDGAVILNVRSFVKFVQIIS